jgi:hypothetical protein
VKSLISSTLGLLLTQKSWKWKLVKSTLRDSERSIGRREDPRDKAQHQGRICVPNVKELKDRILCEAHESAYSIHPGRSKMYHDLKATYWWYGMKRDVDKYVVLCDTYQRVKAEHQ